MKVFAAPLAAAMLIPAAALAGEPFKVFDALSYKNKPETLQALGLEHIYVAYSGQLFPDKKDTPEAPPEDFLKAAAAKFPATTAPVVIDIENWPTLIDDKAKRTTDIANLTFVVRALRSARPDLKFGYYAVIPEREYWAAVDPVKHDGRAWKLNNERLRKELAGDVDAIFPSLYTFYPDKKGWVRYAEENLKEAKQYHKPVYAFLWPEYHDSNKDLKGTNLDADYWKLELETCRRHADGIVIWGGFQKEWDENAPWWKATVEFMKKQVTPGKGPAL
jgi:hypothetical protein